MSFFSQASLVMIPSGYKTSKVYSVVPTSGDGDLVFSRSNDTATRVASNGLIEKVRTNLCLQSQTIDNATSWSNTLDTGATITVTANHAAAPDGTTTAERIQIALNGGAYAQRNQSVTLAAGGEFTYSVYLKSLSGTPTIIFFYDNVNNKTATLTNDWVRYTWTFTSTGNVLPRFVLEAGTSSSADFLAWGCQLETGVATSYIATTTAAVSVGPVANVPRLDYLNSSCPRLLLEPQRTNVLQYSEQIDNAYWTKSNVSVTSNQAVSPDGTTNADLITLAAGTSTKQFYSSSFTAITTNYAYSIFAKKGTHNFIQLLEGPTITINFDLNLGTFNSVSGTSGKIEDYGNGWYRCTMLGTGAVSPASIVNVIAVDSLTSARGQATSSTGTFYAWGAQVESGAYATSYIPTLGAAVTRGADAASKTGISSLIGQTEGTSFIEFEVTHEMTGNNPLYTLSDGTTTNNIYANVFVSGGLNRVEFIVNAGGVAQVTGNVLISNGRHKLAFAYKANDFIAFIDGVQVLVDTSGTVPATSRYGLGSWTNNALMYSDRIAQALLFKTRLSNADLAALTA